MKYVMVIFLFLWTMSGYARQRESVPGLGQAEQLMKQALCVLVADRTGEKMEAVD